jgi:hypothetical protein
MASKCLGTWEVTLRPSTGGEIPETITILTDVGGVLKGFHLPSRKGVDGKCSESGMTISRPDDGTFPRVIYEGTFETEEAKKIFGTYVQVNHVDARLALDAGGDWEGDKTGT